MSFQKTSAKQSIDIITNELTNINAAIASIPTSSSSGNVYTELHLSGQGIPFSMNEPIYDRWFGLPVLKPMELVLGRSQISQVNTITNQTITLRVSVYDSTDTETDHVDLTFGGTKDTIVTSLVCPADSYIGVMDYSINGTYMYSVRMRFSLLFKYT
jgi:hypothetical protein